MKNILLKTYTLIPISKRKKLPTFFIYSFINTLLDFASIAFLVPLVLVLLDKSKLNSIFLKYFGMSLSDNLIMILLVALIVFYVFKNIFQSIIIKNQSKYMYSISSEISENLMNMFIHDNYSNYNKTDKNSFFRDVFQLPIIFSTNILNSFYTIFSELIILAGIILIGILYNPLITLLSVLFLCLFIVTLLVFKKKKINFFNKIIVQLYKKNIKNISNIFQGFVEIKSTKSENVFKETYTKSNKEHNNQLALLSAFKQSNSRYFEILIVIGLSFLILFFLFYKKDANITLLLSFFAGASIKILPSFNKILNSYVDIKANKSCVDLLGKYSVKEELRTENLQFNNCFSLSNISFNYKTKKLLSNINLTIQKGDFISISGKSGEGKSTLLQIISGLQTPNTGTISLDNTAIKTTKNILNFVGYASQQPFLFQGSILENITMLQKENTDLNYINELIDKLDLSDWINSLPNGIHSELLLESKSISGGQKQRIALARTLYFKPDLLLLDESTNQLDKNLELKIFKYLKNLTTNKNLTIIAVSHDATISSFANKKFVLEHKKLIRYEE